jgi:hypothetical protein
MAGPAELATRGDERAKRAAGLALRRARRPRRWLREPARRSDAAPEQKDEAASADDLTTERKEHPNGALLPSRTAERHAKRLPLASSRVKDESPEPDDSPPRQKDDVARMKELAATARDEAARANGRATHVPASPRDRHASREEKAAS